MSSEHEQDLPELIGRREAIKRVSVLLGGVALVGGSGLLASCGRERPAAGTAVGKFSGNDVALLDEVADTILPETKTPGAKAAKVGPFMALMVTDCYDPQDQEIFRSGMAKLEAASQKMNGKSFMDSTPAQRVALLESLDKEQKEYMNAKTEDQRAHWFRMMKELTLLGYFTSEIGYTKAMRYRESPGHYDPCVEYKPGETSWAPHA
jgi:glucoside 3-dehydrogenase (cytochrome c) hitch-hiker subunit